MSEDNKLIKIGEEFGLEESKVQSLMQNFGGCFTEARELVQGARDIKVKDEDDFDNMAKARERRVKLQKVRTGAEKLRKELKAQSLREGRAIEGMANIIKAIVKPVEDYLMGQEKYAEELAKQRKVAVEQERIGKLSKFVENVEGYTLHPDQMGGDTFYTLLTNSEIAYNAQKQAEKEAEETREKKEEAKKAEEKRIRDENEKLKALSSKKNQLINLGVTDVKLLDSVANLTDAEFEQLLKQKEIDYTNEQKRLEKDREEKVELQRELDAKKKVEEDAKLKAEEEEKVKLENECQKALAPDKEKILVLADEVANIQIPSVKDERAMKILVNFREALKNAGGDLRESVKGL